MRRPVGERRAVRALLLAAAVAAGVAAQWRLARTPPELLRGLGLYCVAGAAFVLVARRHRFPPPDAVPAGPRAVWPPHALRLALAAAAVAIAAETVR